MSVLDARHDSEAIPLPQTKNAELERQLAETSSTNTSGKAAHVVLPPSYVAAHGLPEAAEDQGPVPFTSESSPKRCLTFVKEARSLSLSATS